jgi:hypothetical protein
VKDLLTLLGPFVEDMARLRSYNRELKLHGKTNEATKAWNALARTDACFRGGKKASITTFCHYLEEISTRPGPPPPVLAADPECWRVIQEETGHLFKKLGCKKCL